MYTENKLSIIFVWIFVSDFSGVERVAESGDGQQQGR